MYTRSTALYGCARAWARPVSASSESSQLNETTNVTIPQEAAAEAAAKNDAYGIGGEVGGKLNKTYEDLFPHEARARAAESIPDNSSSVMMHTVTRPPPRPFR